MPFASDAVPSFRTVLILHLSGQPEPHAKSHLAALRESGLEVVECLDLPSAEKALRKGCQVGILIASGEEDLELLDQCELLASDQEVCWLGLLSRDLIPLPRVRAFIAEHLFNFITLPAQVGHVVLNVKHAWGMASLRDLHRTPPAVERLQAGDRIMAGRSAEMQQLFARIRKVGHSDAPVLIRGPAGVGKELSAFLIHHLSARAHGPFVSVGCDPEVAEEGGAGLELFRRLDEAAGGTLFLRQITSMPLQLQAGLLRLLEETEAETGGGGTEQGKNHARNVRIIAATRDDLAEAVRQGRFREDLYYRMNVVSVELPPLVHRGEDIEEIARHYLVKLARVHNRSIRGFSRASMHALLAHSWPGNVRELVNRIQHAAVVASGRFIQPEDLGFERSDHARSLSLENARAEAERAMILRALSHSRNKISRAAGLLGISRVTLYRLIEKYNIRPEIGYRTRPPFHPAFRPEVEGSVSRPG